MVNLTNKQILKNLTLLYIEDEDVIRDSLCSTLKLIFKDVIATSNAEEGLEIFKNKQLDMILSDINLPGISGIELSQIIRKEDRDIPIILLTAYTDTAMLLDATKLKLINYLTKPASFDELYSSFIDATKDILRFKNLFIKLSSNISYDTKNSILFDNGIEKDMTASERKLLGFFIENKDRTISIDEIKNYVWEDSYKATDSAFKSLLNKLRHKIGQDCIKSISGIGYYFATL